MKKKAAVGLRTIAISAAIGSCHFPCSLGTQLHPYAVALYLVLRKSKMGVGGRGEEVCCLTRVLYDSIFQCLWSVLRSSVDKGCTCTSVIDSRKKSIYCFLDNLIRFQKQTNKQKITQGIWSPGTLRPVQRYWPIWYGESSTTLSFLRLLIWTRS